MTDHKRIWLEPSPGADNPTYDRQWCQDNVWGDEATEYVRATEIESLRRENQELRKALSRQGDNMAFIINHATLPDQWLDKFSRELDEDRRALTMSDIHREQLDRTRIKPADKETP